VIRQQRLRTGLSLAEVVVSTLLIGILLTAALASVGAAARNTAYTAESSSAILLARQLMDEIVVLPYEDPTPTPEFGLETDEPNTNATRTQLDDIDDYKNWNDSPPRARNGTLLTAYSGWQRTVDVKLIDVDSHSAVNEDSQGDEGLRLITVSVVSPSGEVTTLRIHRAKTAGSLQPQGLGQYIVNYVGIALQTGSGATISGGASILNHAGDQ
jgi:type II secretory pathway pseudopilin PulG